MLYLRQKWKRKEMQSIENVKGSVIYLKADKIAEKTKKTMYDNELK